MDQNPYNPYQPDQQPDPSNQGQSTPYGSNPFQQSQPDTDPYQKPPVPPVVDPYQPYNYQPGVPPVQKVVPPANGLAIASLVLGIVSLVFCLCFGGFLGLPGIAGLILSIVGFLCFVTMIAVVAANPDIFDEGWYYYYTHRF